MSSPYRKVIKALAFISCVCMVGTLHAQNMAFKDKRKEKISTPSPKEGQVPLVDILEKLEQNQGVSFAFQKQFLDGKFSKPVPLLDDDIDTYLTELLTPLQLGYRRVANIAEKIYIIYPLPDVAEPQSSGVSSDSSFTSQTKTGFTLLHGKVNSTDEIGLPGVNVILKGSGLGTTTDQHGNFSLSVPDGFKESLVFSYVGFLTQEVEVTTRRSVDVVMTENPQSLPEIFVTALGINREQKALGYSATTLRADNITSAGNTNFASAIYGKVPGVRIRTAPGGATSAVTMQIRGFNSLNYNAQPLYAIDGVIMRDANEKGASGLNNDDYFTDSRIRGNGILDINPQDIETLTILKGASATALYGSDAAGGVVLITTKRGSAKTGLGVDLNYSATVEQVAFTPKYQNTYGPGLNSVRNIALGADAQGWVSVDTDGNGTADTQRPLFESYGQFGPSMDGQEVMWWDGTTKKYTAQPGNYKGFYRQGFNSAFNISFHNQVERMAYRLSYSRNHYEGIQVGGKLARNTFNLNSTFKLSSKVSTALMVNFSNSEVHNRPLKINRLMSSWTGFFSRAEDISNFFDHYQTREGYKWVPFDQAQRNPEEALKFATPRGYEVMDFLWEQLKNSEDESQNRIISSLTLNYEMLKNLRFRGRVGTDLTNTGTQTKQYNEYPTTFNGAKSTGLYGVARGRYTFVYTDALLTYEKKISKEWKAMASAGVQLRNEKYSDESNRTNGGLVIENWFSLKNSFYPTLENKQTNSKILKYAFLGLMDISYKDIVFLEGTWRQEYSSTLPPANNSYFYPSVNAGFVFSEAFALPPFLSFGKLRASYGVVGNAPPPYEANILYEMTNLQTVKGTVISAGTNGNLYGNNSIRPERKNEMEFGLETRLFENRIGLDLTYYNSRTNGQILKLDLPGSAGATRLLTNAGQLRSEGWELALSASPVVGKLTWTSTLNAAVNSTLLYNLTPGIDQLVFRDFEGGSVRIVAEPGKRVGNIYVHPRKTDTNGNFIISEDGLYVMDESAYSKAGNVLPRITGGIANEISYKNFSIAAQVDYSFGGQIVSPPLKYGKGAGLYENTLQYRDAAHGGLSYYVNDSGENILLSADAANNGGPILHNGVLLQGVTGDGQPNTKVIDAATYYINMFDWGDNAWNEAGMVYDNSYIKMREIVFSYRLPRTLTTKLHFQQVTVSLLGRNLFYLWKTLENLDPESTIGSNWLNQSIDDGSGAATRSYGFSVNMKF